jgi:hypothetical protein
MKKTSICLVALLAFCMLSLIVVSGVNSQVNETQNIKIGSYSYYIDSLGGLVVVGEIQNIGPDVIDQVVLTGTATSSDGGQSGSYAIAWVAQLLPQQKAPFYMEFYPPQNENGWYGVGGINLNVESANATSSYQYPDLKITSSSGSVGTSGDYNGAYMVTGTIQNTGIQAATNLTVVGTFFNSTGVVVGAGYTNYLTPQTLNPSDSLSFQVAAFDLNQSIVPSNLKITSYSLLVQTQEPLLQGNAPVATPYTGSGGSSGSQNPTPTLAPGQTSQNSSGSSILGVSQANTLIYAAVIAVAIVVVATAFLLFRKKRRASESAAPAEKPAPVYKPKPTRRNRK